MRSQTGGFREDYHLRADKHSEGIYEILVINTEKYKPNKVMEVYL